MRVAHVRERHGPAGAPWRLAVAAGHHGTPGPWLDADVVRRRLAADDPCRAHNAALFRQPLATLDDLLGRGLRVAALAELIEGFARLGGPRED